MRLAVAKRRRKRREAGGDYSDAIIALAEAAGRGIRGGRGKDGGGRGSRRAAFKGFSRGGSGCGLLGAGNRQPSRPGPNRPGLGTTHGESLHVIKVSRSGMVQLRTASDFHWQGGTS